MNIIRSHRLVWVLVMLSVASTVSGQSSDEKKEFDTEITESVFRYQIKQCAENTIITVFLLSMNGKDPSDEFMKRFADDAQSVKKRSALAKFEPTSEYIDKESGKFAALLSITKLQFLEDGKAEVEGSCGHADSAAKGYRYSLVREKDRWIVKRAAFEWVF